MSKIYCVKCKDKKDVNNEEIRTTKNNRKMLSGICSQCGTKCNQFLKKDSNNEVKEEKKEL